MKVVAHQAKGMHLPPRFLAGFGERFQKTPTVPVSGQQNITFSLTGGQRSREQGALLQPKVEA